MKRIALFLFLILSVINCFAQTQIDPTYQIAWNLLSGAGAPTITCTQSGNYTVYPYGAEWGQSYQDTTNNAEYKCTTSGWVKNLPATGGTLTGPLNGTSASFSGTVVAGASITSPNINTTLHSRGYGCKGDGITDDTACMVDFGNAVVAAAASGPVTMVFDPGRYMVNPLNGMTPFPMAGATVSYLFDFYASAASNLTVIGQSATIALLPYTASTYPTQHYNQQVGIASGSVFTFWNFRTNGSHIHYAGGLMFDGNGQSLNTDSGGYGQFWDDGMFQQPASQLSDYQVTGETFTNLYGWPVLVGNTKGIGIINNHADHSEGMVCQNGAVDCQIALNYSANDLDAPYACNGGTGTAVPANMVTNCTISNNHANTSTNGDGIDITAVDGFSVTDNIVENENGFCVLIDRSSGPFLGGPTTSILPSSNGIVSNNTCIQNNTYGGWQIPAEILVGDEWAWPNNNSGNVAWTAGSTASNIQISNNHITALNITGTGVAVGFGAAHVTVSGNDIIGCGNGGSLICSTSPYRITTGLNGQQANTSIDDVSITGNKQHDLQSGAKIGIILINGTLATFEDWGNNMGTNVAGSVATEVPFSPLQYGTINFPTLPASTVIISSPTGGSIRDSAASPVSGDAIYLDWPTIFFRDPSNSFAQMMYINNVSLTVKVPVANNNGTLLPTTFTGNGGNTAGKVLGGLTCTTGSITPATTAGGTASGTCTLSQSATGHTGFAAASDGSVQGIVVSQVSASGTTATVTLTTVIAGSPTAKSYNVTVF